MHFDGTDMGFTGENGARWLALSQFIRERCAFRDSCAELTLAKLSAANKLADAHANTVCFVTVLLYIAKIERY